MIITLQQTLHGYQNGHQVLASSIPIGEEGNKVLLFQSDLSGTLINANFESYITGYPLASESLYAFARTWYASEMRRPGCVWTQTLLIRYPDLGKIPDLLALVKLFERPIVNEYDKYNSEIEVEFNSLLRSSENISNREINNSIYQILYENSGVPIIIPASSPNEYENEIINLWSNQWPRLRRNFFFCSGALNLKSLNNRLFDLQIIPEESLKSVSRSETEILIYHKNDPIHDWVKILHTSKKNDLRKFLWNFGSDIDGFRKNYIPLIKLYHLIYFEKDFHEVNSLIQTNFSNPKQGKNIKSKIYTEDSLIDYPESEKEIVKYLLFAPDLDYLDGITLNIERRLINLLQNGKIQLEELLSMIFDCPSGRISNHLWDEIELPDNLILDLLARNYATALPLILRSENIVYSETIWRLPHQQQRDLFFQFLQHNLIRDWPRLIKVILEVGSELIFELYWKNNDLVFNSSLEWYNQGKATQQFTAGWKDFITKEKDQQFIKWLRTNERRIHSKMFALIFDNLASRKILTLGFSHNTWLTAYKKLKLTEYRGNVEYIASLLLTIGFNNDIANSEWLVSVTFQDVYVFAENLQLGQHNWNIIPKDFEENMDNDDWGIIETLVNILKFKPKKQYQVESWDYCENLIRTFCNKTIKNNWNPGAFLSTLKEPKLFYRAAAYCVTFKKGRQLTMKIIRHIENRQIQFEPFQYQYLRKIKKLS
ncbi:hypothetical protein [Pedobacter mucosus]|uniref:GAP1-N1 domain-containing protein n=1 Tax=Pedobacter mucosus TaxID=2895286 RepID=UPI001EE3AABC|nr:hypothetical protein [Pedobacter mucosus]UKT65092.1 hypothetical protein LOK61_04770 [Pedobacter mucosus]